MGTFRSNQIMSKLFALALLFVAVAMADFQEGDGLIMTTTHKASCANGAKAGDKLTMHYTGTIDPQSATGVKNQKFDSSLDRGTPFTFTLGQGSVIKGWDQGLKGICPGEKRKLVIPPKLGYGANGAGAKIPGGATLDFTVECLKVNDKE